MVSLRFRLVALREENKALFPRTELYVVSCYRIFIFSLLVLFLSQTPSPTNIAKF